MPPWDGVIAPTVEGRGFFSWQCVVWRLADAGWVAGGPSKSSRGAQGLEGCAAQRRPAKLFELRAWRRQKCWMVFEGEFFAGLPGPSTAGNPPRSGGQTPGPPATHPAAATLKPKQSEL